MHPLASGGSVLFLYLSFLVVLFCSFFSLLKQGVRKAKVTATRNQGERKRRKQEDNDDEEKDERKKKQR